MGESDTLRWEAPEPGLWAFDPVHTNHPASGLSSRIGRQFFTVPFAAGAAKVGSAIGGWRFVLVNGWYFANRSPAPEEELPQREKAAQEMLATRGWRAEGERWYAVERPAIRSWCQRLQARVLTNLDDGALAEHLHETVAAQGLASKHHFEHIALTFVIGELVLACGGWGTDAGEALELLTGASPASSSTASYLARIADALRAAGCRPRSLDDVRAASDEAAAALNEYLAEYGSRTTSGFDVDDLTLGEMADVVLASVLGALDRPVEPPSADAYIAAAREKVPADERERFDDLLSEARYVYGLRDDDVGPWMWARGLTRLAALEAGRRLEARGAIKIVAHALEAGPDEISDLLAGGDAPSAAELADRADLRAWQATLVPPAVVGKPEPVAQPELPPTVARITRAQGAYMSPPKSIAEGDGLRGFGIGRQKHRGRARVAHRAEDAFAKLEPGDVLITAMTTPAFNGILPIAGALVVRDAGLMSHAAIMARELGIPAVIGVARALDDIPDGAMVEVDPVEGIVRVLEEGP